MNSTPLTADQLAAIRQRAFSTKCAPNHPGALFTFMDGAKDAVDLLAEVDRQRGQLEDARQLIRDFDQGRQSAVAERDTFRTLAMAREAAATKLVTAWLEDAATDVDDDDAFKRGVASGMAFCADALTALLNGQVTS